MGASTRSITKCRIETTEKLEISELKLYFSVVHFMVRYALWGLPLATAKQLDSEDPNC